MAGLPIFLQASLDILINPKEPVSKAACTISLTLSWSSSSQCVVRKDFAPGLGGSDICHFCTKRVYVMERLSAEGYFFHRECFRCHVCNSTLRLGGHIFDSQEGTFDSCFVSMFLFYWTVWICDFCVLPLQESSTARCIIPSVSPALMWGGSEGEW